MTLTDPRPVLLGLARLGKARQKDGRRRPAGKAPVQQRHRPQLDSPALQPILARLQPLNGDLQAVSANWTRTVVQLPSAPGS